MTSKRVLVTGPTGFIGVNLVKRLVNAGADVTALVRSTSDTTALEALGVTMVRAELHNLQSLASAVANQEVIYHLAAAARAVHLSTFKRVNLDGFENLILAAINAGHHPKLILVSSLAAVGPSAKNRPHHEGTVANPISNYGKSKRAAEWLAAKYSDRLDISIVRPPIVLGPHDAKGLEIFKTISQLAIHIRPGLKNSKYSVIHVADLCEAMIAVAERGRCVRPDNLQRGTYFAAADEIMTYAELGQMIGRALGKRNTLNLPILSPILKMVGGFNTLLGNLQGAPRFLNYDKVRDVTAGCWACENKKLKQETGFEFPATFAKRIQQTAKWYRDAGWLDSGKIKRQQIAPVGSAVQTGHHSCSGPTINVN